MRKGTLAALDAPLLQGDIESGKQDAHKLDVKQNEQIDLQPAGSKSKATADMLKQGTHTDVSKSKVTPDTSKEEDNDNDKQARAVMAQDVMDTMPADAALKAAPDLLDNFEYEIKKASVVALSHHRFYHILSGFCTTLQIVLNCCIMGAQSMGFTQHSLAAFAGVNTFIKGIETHFELGVMAKNYNEAKKMLRKCDADLNNLQIHRRNGVLTGEEVLNFKKEFLMTMGVLADSIPVSPDYSSQWLPANVKARAAAARALAAATEDPEKAPKKAPANLRSSV